jgi:hypothetical protein
MAKKPNTGAGGSGARQVLQCSGKNVPANNSIANLSQDHCAENFGARQPRPYATGRPRLHRGHVLVSDDEAVGRKASGPLVITLKAQGREKFDVIFDGKAIIQSSSQPICEAARALRDFGYPDDFLLVVWHLGADHEAIRGPLGVWRRLRIREVEAALVMHCGSPSLCAR